MCKRKVYTERPQRCGATRAKTIGDSPTMERTTWSKAKLVPYVLYGALLWAMDYEGSPTMRKAIDDVALRGDDGEVL